MATVYVMTAGGGNTYRGAGLPGIRTGLRVRAGLQRHRPGGTGAGEEWQAGAPPDAEVVRRELTGVPKTEVVGQSNDKVEELFWDTITQARAYLAGTQRK